MHRKPSNLLVPRALRKAISVWLSVMLIVLQAHMAFAGCVMKPIRAASDAAIAVAAEHCHANEGALKQACLRHCEQAGESPASASEHNDYSALAGVSVTALLPYQQTASTPGSGAVAGQAPPAMGPPVYLRFARLLN